MIKLLANFISLFKKYKNSFEKKNESDINRIMKENFYVNIILNKLGKLNRSFDFKQDDFLIFSSSSDDSILKYYEKNYKVFEDDEKNILSKKD